MEKAKIFVEYARKDGTEIPGNLVSYLRSKGYDVWWDQDLDAGIPWAEEIFSQIRERDLVIVFIKESALESKWVARAIDIARGAYTSVLPITLIDSHWVSSDPLFIKDYQFLPYEGGNWDEFPVLTRSIDRLAERTRNTRRLKSETREDPISKSLFGLPVLDERFECDIFMMMPFRDHLNPVYEDHIKKVAGALDFKIRRGDDPFSRHDIMREIWSFIYNSRLVIADCTERNPNVFYELGIAHTLGKPAILITQNIDDVPFDVRNRRVIVSGLSLRYIITGHDSSN